MKVKTFISAIILFVVIFGNNISAQNEKKIIDCSNFPKYEKGVVIVTLKKGYTIDDISATNQSIGVTKIQRTFVGYDNNHLSLTESDMGGVMWTIRFSEDKNIYDIINLYNNNNAVISACANTLYYSSKVPNDTYYNNQGYLYDIYKASIKAESAWDINDGVSSIKVGIIDSGVDTDHTDLDGHLLSGYDYTDTQDSSYYDGVFYWTRCQGDYQTPDSNPEDEHGHGTLISGIIGAETNNNSGYAGIAWDVQLLPIRAGARFYTINDGDTLYTNVFQFDDLVNAVNYARTQE